MDFCYANMSLESLLLSLLCFPMILPLLPVQKCSLSVKDVLQDIYLSV